MATSRFFGGTSFTTRPPIAISPSLTCSSPAIIRSKVDFPQPDGPSSTTNERSSMVTSTPCNTSMLPKRLTTDRTSTVAISSPPIRGSLVLAPGPSQTKGRRKLVRFPTLAQSIVRRKFKGSPLGRTFRNRLSSHLLCRFFLRGFFCRLLRRLVKPHHIAFGVLEHRDPAHVGRNFRLRHDHRAACILDLLAGCIDRGDRQIIHERLVGHLSLDQAAVDTLLALLPGLDEEIIHLVRIGYLPSESLFVEAFCPFQVIGWNFKVNHCISHDTSHPLAN